MRIFREGTKMNLAIRPNVEQFNQRKPQFKGALDGVITNTFRVLDTNEMINAVVLDVGPMSIPRGAYDWTHRNKYAGMETLAREFQGTFINCLSAGVFATIISKVASKYVNPETKINPNCWFSENSLKTLEAAWNKSENLDKYIETVFDNINGLDGHETRKFTDINWENIEWIDKKSWAKIKWNNPNYKSITEQTKSKDGLIKAMKTLIEDNAITKNDRGNALRIISSRITNALGAERNTSLTIGDNKLNDKLDNILRDSYDIAKDIFNNKNINKADALKKIRKINNLKIGGALSIACALGITNQYINRKITEKRTGKKGFVGDVNYTSANHQNKKDKFLPIKKAIASVGMAAMVLGVMKVKNAKDFVKKLEFTGPVTSGNAIKTVYGFNIIGRFIAADNGTELRESVTRDYLGFLNWLVLGGFAAKGVGNLLDKRGEALFNHAKEGKGIKHWLNDLSLKTHSEIAAKGSNFAKKNMWKLNAAHACGITYSAVTLGLLLPMLNDKVTRYKAKKANLC